MWGDVLGQLGVNFAVLVVAILILWGISLKIRDVSFIDAFWAGGMVLLAWVSFWQVWPGPGEGGVSPQGNLIVVLTTLWGARLGVHLFVRWWKTGEDPRYKRILGGAMEQKGWSFAKASLLLVFATQAPLLFFTSLPAQLGILAIDGYPALNMLSWAGVVIALVGIAFETIGDWQLNNFRADPDNRNKVMDKGLWRYTRHPNYFGDACTWWGVWLVAASVGWEIALASLIGPVFLTFTLTRWSGKPLLERGMAKTRPGYADYVARTSGFIPWPPKYSPKRL